jgi:hypothetical protein
MYAEMKGITQGMYIECKCKMCGRSSVKLHAFVTSTLDTRRSSYHLRLLTEAFSAYSNVYGMATQMIIYYMK